MTKPSDKLPMPLEYQVPSLELSKRLKELGVKQESLFYWQHHVVNGNDYLRTKELVEKSIYPFEAYVSAFTVSELGEMLPGNIIKKNGENMWWQSHKTSNGRIVVGWKDTGSVNDWERLFMFESTEANARAKMLIYLLENKLI